MSRNRKEERIEREELREEILIEREIHLIRLAQEGQLHAIREIVRLLTPGKTVPKAIITQLNGGTSMSAGTIKGTPAGGTSTFGETDAAGFTDPTGVAVTRKWSLTDPSNSTTGTPSTDPKVSQFSVAAAASAPVGQSYTLQYTDTDANGNVLEDSGAVQVPFLPAVVAAPVDAVINQLS